MEMGKAMMEIGMSTFRVTGRTVEMLFGREWLEVWEIKVVENYDDLAIDVDLAQSTTWITKREQPIPEGASRYIPKNDIVSFKLENGKTVTMEMTPAVNEMLKTLVSHGVRCMKRLDAE
jgi:hypothetical protein